MVSGEFRLVLMVCPKADFFEGRIGYDKTVQDNVFLEYVFAKFGVMRVFFALLGFFFKIKTLPLQRIMVTFFLLYGFDIHVG